MPLFSYFAVVGTVLVGLMFAADAYWGTPEPLKLSTDSYGVPGRKAAEPVSKVPILTVREAPRANLSELTWDVTTVAPANGEPVASATVEPPKKAAKPAHSGKKHPAKVVRTRDNRDRYARTFQPADDVVR